MRYFLIGVAKIVYRAMPLKSIRRFFYGFFLQLVRGRFAEKEVEGSIYSLDLSEKIDVAMYLDQFEKDLVNAIKQHCQPGMVVLDIGANIGAHSLLFSKLVGPAGYVYGFEPTDYAFNKLLINLDLNSRTNIEVFKVACADVLKEEKEVDFRASWCTDGSRKDYPCTVKFEPLDHWAEIHNLDAADVIKLDVDGNEFSVLQGAENVINTFGPMIFLEVWGPNFQDSARDPFVLLERHGYKFYSLDGEIEYQSAANLVELVSSPEGTLLDFSVNIMAIKQ